MSIPNSTVRLPCPALVFACACAALGCGPSAQEASGGGTSTNAGGNGGGGAATTATTMGTGGLGGGGGTGGEGGTRGPTFETQVITARHRADPGKMFGGWGPHLGHLVRAKIRGEAALYWVDDVCSQAGGRAPVCDVNKDFAIGIFRKDGSTWTDLGETPLPGTVQQNTGSLATGALLRTYGIDVTGHVVQECTYDVATGNRACGALPFALDPYANYIGAAVSPQGSRMVWWTDVADGGGGLFEYVVDYGGGWNGPRTGGIGGYNDSSYIHIGFRADTTAFTMHGQLVSGLAPNWSFLGAVGEGDLATTDPVVWQNTLAAPPGDPIESTDDVHVDPVTSDTHLFARAKSGAAVYYFRPKSGAWTGPLASIPGAYRLRSSVSSAGLAIVYSTAGAGLRYKHVPNAAIVPGAPVDWPSLAEHDVPLPAGYENIYAIYPESLVYQTEPVPGIAVALVGAERENEALFVGIQP